MTCISRAGQCLHSCSVTDWRLPFMGSLFPHLKYRADGWPHRQCPLIVPAPGAAAGASEGPGPDGGACPPTAQREATQTVRSTGQCHRALDPDQDGGGSHCGRQEWGFHPFPAPSHTDRLALSRPGQDPWRTVGPEPMSTLLSYRGCGAHAGKPAG